jgi:hypothetical protein
MRVDEDRACWLPVCRPGCPSGRGPCAVALAACLLCTGKLKVVLGDEQTERVLAEHAMNDAQAVWTIWTTAMNANGPDNITTALMRRHAGRLDGRG